MADASYAQTSFLGGELSEWSQGRFDLPRYKIGLAEATNLLIVDEGAAPRRPGTQFLGTTRNGSPGRLIPFDFAEATPYNLEFTDGYLRFWNGTQLATSNDSQTVLSISIGSPAVFYLGQQVTWATGDQVYFNFSSPAQAANGGVLLNRTFNLTMLSTTSFTIADAITGLVITGSMLGNAGLPEFEFDGPISSGSVSDQPLSGSPTTRAIITSLSPIVNHISQVQTLYTVAGNDWHSLRLVQGYDLGMLLHGSVSPYALQVLVPPTDTEYAVFEFGPAQFQDGPYLDPPTNAIANSSALAGSVQITCQYPAWVSTTTYGYGVTVTYNSQDYISLVNNNYNKAPSSNPAAWETLTSGSMINSSAGFLSTDVGRMMRLFSEPNAWSSSTTYSAGQNVAYNGSYFTSLINSNTNNEPDISLTDWVINTSVAIYTWGIITQVLSANQVSLQINGSPLISGNGISAFQLGAWSNTTGWPTCGCYQGGRFWFGGAIPNRVDSSQPDDPFNMAPTLQDGTVTDSNGISYTFNSNSVDQIFWMLPNSQGVLIGTQRGEYLLSSGTTNGPITPSSIADSPLTKYGSSNILPAHTGLTICFVQRLQRRLLEYLNDTFNSSRFYGPDLMTFARHLGAREFEELAYQQEPAPIVWGRMGDGSLIGTTYRRVSLFLNQEPEFNAWHKHVFGSNRLVESICVGPSNGGTLDTLAMVTNDPSTGIRYVESLTELMDETDPLTTAWFLDCAVTPQAAAIVIVNGVSCVQFYGLNYLNGQKVSVFAAAIDCGDYIVENGTVNVPIGTVDVTTGFAFNTTAFNLLQPLAAEFSDMSVTVIGSGVQYQIPCVIGFNYQSQGQLCRPMLQPDTGARNGPGFAKKRKTARYGMSLAGTLGVQVGTEFSKTYPVKLLSPGLNPLPYLSTYTGIVRDTLADDYSFDSMLCWQTTRPYPATVTAFGGFISTEDV